MGVAKSVTDSELEFFASQLEGVIRLELPNQRQLLALVREMGAPDRGGSLGKAPATVAYTSFLLSVAAQGGPIEILAAILPCAWSYAEIVARLRIADHPVYRDWISFYLTDEVLGLVRQMRERFDEMAARVHPDAVQVHRLLEIFLTSSQLEGGFWDMAYTLEQWPRPAPGPAERRSLVP
jgi:thiaminase (transcriptional activator TenA)